MNTTKNFGMNSQDRTGLLTFSPLHSGAAIGDFVAIQGLLSGGFNANYLDCRVIPR